MKIVDLKVYAVGAAWRNLIFIRVDIDQGVSGCAEATSHNKTRALLGETLGQPVWRPLGGRCRERIPAYANGSYTVDRKPELFAARARDVAGMGYRALKFDPFGGGGLELSRPERLLAISLVEAVRDAVGPETG